MDEDVRVQAAALAAAFRAKGKKVQSNVAKAITKACLIVERDAKLSMTNTIKLSPMFVALHGGKANGHLPSQPGSPPAVDTGRLRASITHRIEGGGWEKTTRGYVGTNVIYGRYLEFGTSRMAARPWLIPALERHRKEIALMLKNATMNAVQGKDENA
jgi:HK97 gp10 family phage protein